jgi:hypothetical protein
MSAAQAAPHTTAVAGPLTPQLSLAPRLSARAPWRHTFFSGQGSVTTEDLAKALHALGVPGLRPDFVETIAAHDRSCLSVMAYQTIWITITLEI